MTTKRLPADVTLCQAVELANLQLNNHRLQFELQYARDPRTRGLAMHLQNAVTAAVVDAWEDMPAGWKVKEIKASEVVFEGPDLPEG